MAINFPSSPTNNQTFDAGEVVYKYDANKNYWYAFKYSSSPIGFTGSQGDRGYTGSQGNTGAQGPIGFTGSQGNTGAQGSTGFTGSQGNIGFTGSQGVQGNQGVRGYTGSAAFGSWNFVPSGNDLLIQFNGVTKAKFASDGSFTAADDITAFGNP
jgi:hypothetical protein